MKRIVASLFCTLGISTGAQASLITFMDSTFSPANYGTPQIYQSDSSVTITVSQSTSVGNPSPSLQFAYTNTGGPVNLLSKQGIINNTFTYNPGVQGAITGIDFSVDKFTDFGATLNSLLTLNSRLLLLQGGNYYYATIFDPQFFLSWNTTTALNLQASAFALIDFSTNTLTPGSNPDFSSAGSVLSFGLAQNFTDQTAGVTQQLNGQFDYDNLSVTVHNNTSSVPEPGTGALLALSLCGMWLTRRRTQ